MRRREVSQAVAAAGLAGACAELAVRRLSPGRPLPGPVGGGMADHFTPEQVVRGAAYTRGQLALGLAAGALQLAALALAARRPARGPAALTAGRLAVLSSLASLPARACGRRRAVAAGLATQSWGSWALDQAKAAAIELPLVASAGELIARASCRWPEGWWLPVSAGAVAFGGGLAALAPVVLDPLFNDFQPLGGELRAEVLGLAERAGVRLRDVQRMDASRRTSAANAYVSGWGPTRRVVLYDTLLDRYPAAEIRVVVAHELAHVQGRDVGRGIAFGALTAPAAALAAQRVARALSPARQGAEALGPLALSASLLAAPLGLFAGRLSRALERRADAVSLELTDDPEAFIALERRLSVQNLADVEPPWWARQLLASHPSTGERIAMARGYAKERAGASRPR